MEGEERISSIGRTGQGRFLVVVTTIRLAPKDISRARALASRRGLRYQTYLKMLLQEAIEAEEKKLTGPNR